jgi:hypothetical protein
VKSPVAFVFAFIWVAYIAISALILGVDPYDQYPWGAPSRLGLNWHPFEAPRLIRLAAKDPTVDTVLIGSSPTTMYSPQDISEAFPDAKNPWNISYHGATEFDRNIVLNEFIRYSSANRFIVTLDFFYALSGGPTPSDFPSFMYDNNPLHALRIVNVEALRATLNTLRRGSPFPLVEQMRRSEQSFNEGAWQVAHEKMMILSMREAIAEQRAVVAAKGKETCEQLPGLQHLIEGAKALSAKGADVLIYVPSYSFASYFWWQHDPELRRRYGGKTMLSDQLLLRRCAVILTQGIERVAIYSNDLEPGFASNYRNYRDDVHLYGRGPLMGWLRMSEHEKYRLTVDNIDAYIRELEQRVRDYEFIDTDRSS